MPSPDDFLKVTDGPQAVVDKDGNVAVLMTFTPDGAKLLVESCKHAHEHNCAQAAEFARFVMYVAGALVVDLYPQSG